MKTKLLLVLCSFMLLSMQCDDENDVISQEILDNKKQEIVNYINSFSCSEDSNCNYIAFGAKPCGGPREYLAFSSNVDVSELQIMVDQYYTMDNDYNVQTGAASDCAIVGPPTNVDCINGVCTIID